MADKKLSEAHAQIVRDCAAGKIRYSEAAERCCVSFETIRRWVRNYNVAGESYLSPERKRRYLSSELMESAVKAYLAGEGSMTKICERYGIHSDATLRYWLKKYREGKLIVKKSPKEKSVKAPPVNKRPARKKPLNPNQIAIAEEYFASGKNKMATAQKFNVSVSCVCDLARAYIEQGGKEIKFPSCLTKERIAIVREFIASGRNYKEITLKYNLSLRQIYSWTKKYMKRMGIEFTSKREMNPLHVAIAKECIDAGKDYRAIALKHNLKSTQVRQWTNAYIEHGGEDVIIHKRMPLEQAAIARDCIASGKNHSATALKYNVSYAEVYKWTKAYLEQGGEDVDAFTKTPAEKRLIAKECIESGFDYANIAMKHNVSCRNVCIWTKAYIWPECEGDEMPRKVSLIKRNEIVKDYLASGRSYVLISMKYNVPYDQLCFWTQIYLKNNA